MHQKVLISVGVVTAILGIYGYLMQVEKSDPITSSKVSILSPPKITQVEAAVKPEPKFSSNNSRKFKSSNKISQENVNDFVIPSTKESLASKSLPENLKPKKSPWVKSLSGSESQIKFLNAKQKEQCTTEECAYKKGEPIQLVGLKVETSQGKPAKKDWMDGDFQMGNGARDPVLFVD